jgi:hypothetical protein
MTFGFPNLKHGAALPNQMAAIEQRLGPITYVGSAQLTSYANNPRKHPEKQIVKLMASIREFGVARPILVDVNNVIVDGTAVVEAARRLEIPELPVIFTEYWSNQQVQAYRMASNRLAELAKWDDELLAIELASIIEFDEVPVEVLGWEDSQLDNIIEGEASEFVTDPADVIPRASELVVARTGDLWRLGKHRLLCGSVIDSSAWTVLMDGKIASTAFTSPRYYSLAAMCPVTDPNWPISPVDMPCPAFRQFLINAVAQIAGNLADGAFFDFCVGRAPLAESLASFNANGLLVMDMCVWVKDVEEGGILYNSKHELVLITKKGNVPNERPMELVKEGRCRTNVWNYPVGIDVRQLDDIYHTNASDAVKPVALVADAICDVTFPNEIVIDGFACDGTTILAAERTGRLCYSMDANPAMIDLAIGRWEAMTGEHATLISTGETFAKVAARRAAESQGAD